MNENETLQFTNAIDCIKNQLTKKRIPNSTLLFGTNPKIILSSFLRLMEDYYQKPVKLTDEESDNFQEPQEDIIIISSEKSIKIDTIKQLQNRIKYGPSSQPFCIVFIYTIEKCTHSAQNALLKSIEEPPENTLFFLATGNRFQIPETIQSRGQRFFIPDNSEDAKLDHLINEINEKTTFVPSDIFLKKTQFEKITFIQNLPYDPRLMEQILNAWTLSIYLKWPDISKKEQLFLDKIIEIISKIKYNLNLKLQLTNATLQMEEDDSQ
tara:strand:+ start:50 stop:850 length:801 start_codon:yes stop_codon:yes gene_type:complete